MVKEHHLKRFIDRLMMVPREPLEHADGGIHGKNPPIDHAGASLPNSKSPKGDAGIFGEDHDDAIDQDKPLSSLEHAQIMDRDHLTDEHEPDGPGKEPVSHESEENPGHSLEGLLDQKNPKKPHDALKEGNLSASDHEKKVKMDRARHAKIYGDH